MQDYFLIVQVTAVRSNVVKEIYHFHLGHRFGSTFLIFGLGGKLQALTCAKNQGLYAKHHVRLT